MRALAIILAFLLSGCASVPLRPIEVVSMVELYAQVRPPDPISSSEVVGSSHPQELANLRAWALDQGFTIEFADLQTHGYVGSVFRGTITLDEALTPDGQLNVLLHELAHPMLPFGKTKQESETLAETVAYLVAQNLHWNTPESLGYMFFIPKDIRASITMRFEKQILRVVNTLTTACQKGISSSS